MFTSGLAEANSGVIDIQGTDGDTMTSLLQYIYSSNIQITTDNVQSLVQVNCKGIASTILYHSSIIHPDAYFFQTLNL